MYVRTYVFGCHSNRHKSVKMQAYYPRVWTGSLTGITTHKQRVQLLYKRALRNLEAFLHERYIYRYQAVLLRQRFDENKCISEPGVAEELLCQGEKEYFESRHWQLRQFPNSPGGTAYAREVTPPDWIVDHWDPLEKAQYPEYFARREQRKKEFVDMWQKQYGKNTFKPPH